MKTTINTPSQNEVRELLHEYVVEPMKEKLAPDISSVEGKIEEAEKTIKKEVQNITGAVSYHSGEIKKQLKEQISDVKEELENSKEDISQELGRVSKQLDKAQENRTAAVLGIHETLTQIQTNISGTQTLLNTVKTEVSTALDGHAGQLNTSIDRLEASMKAANEERKNETENLHTLIDARSDAFSKQLELSFQNNANDSEKAFAAVITKLKTAEESAETNHQALLELITVMQKDVFERFLQSHEEIKTELKSEIQSTELRLAENAAKHYKTLFAIALSFGIADTIGLISMILLFLLK